MKILVNKNQYKKLINEISLLDVIKQADESDILSLEIPNITNSLNLKLTRQAMENVLTRGVSELEKYIESPEKYIKSLAIEEIPTPPQEIPTPPQEIPTPPQEPPKPQEELESPKILQKIKEIEISQEYLDELTSKKGYKSRRDRDNIDLLKINIARLNRDLDKLRNISESKNLVKRTLREQGDEITNDIPGFEGTLDKLDNLTNDFPMGDALERLRVVLEQLKSLQQNKVINYMPDIKEHGSQRGVNHNLINSIKSIVKLFGASWNHPRHSTDWQIVWWFIDTFKLNGGYKRNFKEGPIKLPEITIYEMEAQFIEEVFESRTSWGDLMGAESEEEAEKWYEADMHAWEEDTEHQDSDYGDITEIEDVEVRDTRILKFDPNWVGL